VNSTDRERAAGRAGLCDVIRAQAAQITDRWDETARSREPLRRGRPPILLPQLPELLDCIAEILRAPREPDAAALDPFVRAALAPLHDDVDLQSIGAEFALLRAAILATSREQLGSTVAIDDVVALDAIIDHAVAVSTGHLLAREQEARAQLHAVLQSIPEAIYVGNMQGITLANDAALEQLGYANLEELNHEIATLGEQIQTRYVDTGERIPVDDEAFVHGLRGEKFTREVRVRHLGTAEDRILRSAAAPVMVGGAVVGSVAVNTDISELKRAQEARERLLASEQNARAQAQRTLALLDTLLAASPVGIAFLDRDLRYVRINEALATINGKPVDAHLGRPVREVLPDVADAIVPILQRVIDTGEPVIGLEFSAALPADGALVRTWNAYYYPVETAGEVLGIGALVFEVTDRKRSEARLREWQQVFTNTATGVVVVDAESQRMVHVNPALAEMHGYTPDELVGKPFAELLAPEASADIEEHAAIAHAKGQHQHESVHLRADGTRLPVLANVTAVKDQSGRVVQRIGTLLDISDRKRAEEELARTASFREQFIGILGHDLRNPLNAIRASADVILMHDNLHPGQAKGVRRIIASADRMARMINDVLDFTRGRLGGGIPVQRTRANLHEVVQQTVDELHVAHPDRDFGFEATGDGWGFWDADRVAQVVSNLVGNALQHGSIAAPIRIAVCDLQQNVVVRVTNTGQSIPQTALPTLFEPFRGSVIAARRTKNQGLGLGLFIVNEIVRAHGGTIDVQSSEHATTFSVVLPRGV